MKHGPAQEPAGRRLDAAAVEAQAAARRAPPVIPYAVLFGIAAELRAGKTVLVAAHGNSLRALVKHLEGISDADIAELNIPTGNPLRYEFDADGNVTGKGVYLDPEAAAAGAAAVAAQGQK